MITPFRGKWPSELVRLQPRSLTRWRGPGGASGWEAPRPSW